MNIMMIIIYVAPIILGYFAWKRGDASFQKGLLRGMEQLAIILPRMVCALIAAEFLAMLLPAAFISQFLGDEAGLTAILIGSLTGLLVPSGPVISFSIAATFANAGAAIPAVIAFLTAWSLFSAHRVLIYEIPLLGMNFLRLRVVSVLILPVLSGIFTLAGTALVELFSAP